MKNILTVAILATLAACGTTTPQAPAASRAQVETCWKQAGIAGDLYRFFEPAKHGKLNAAGAVTQAQADSFNTCIGYSA